MPHISVIGGGAWGTALAAAFTRAGNSVLLWAREEEVAASVNQFHENTPFLPGVKLPEALQATNQLAEVAKSDMLCLVVPAQFLRSVGQQLATLIKPGTPLVLCAKGIENTTQKLMSEVTEEVLPGHPLLVLSGPNFADEIARGLPAATTLACRDKVVAERLAGILGSETFRPYIATDIIGAQIGGSVKNVLAIACGIAAGKHFGESAKAALITRGLAEMRRMCIAKGGQAETLMGLSGIGDLLLTCGSLKSRNMSLGFALGEGKPLAEILASRKSVAEGVPSAIAVHQLARQLRIDMPICDGVHAILHENAAVEGVIKGLLTRPYREES